VNLLHVVHCFPPEPTGGTERVVLSLVRALRERGHRVRVLAGSLQWERGFRVDREEHLGIPVIRVRRDDPWFDRWDAAYNPTVEDVFRRVLRRERPDLVHVHHWIRLTSNLVQIAREEGVPAVVHIHDFHPTCPRTFRVREDGSFCTESPSPETCLRCAERWPFQGDQEIRARLVHYLRDFLNEMRCARMRLAPTESHGRAVADFFREGIGPVEVLPPGWEEPLQPGRPRGKAGEGPLKVAHWGNLYDLKGTALLLKAFRRAAGKAPMELVILGPAVEESFGEELRREARGLPVEFRGKYGRRDLENLEAHLAVFPSLCRESYGMALDEAFMLGLPVVVSDAGALPERVGDGGWVVPRGDGDALAETLERIALDRSLLEEKARSVPRTWITVSEAARRAEEFYEEILGGGGESLPPLRPLGYLQRLNLAWFVQALRLSSLLGAKDAWPSGWRAPEGDS